MSRFVYAGVGFGSGTKTRFCLASQICLPNLGVASSRLGSFDWPVRKFQFCSCNLESFFVSLILYMYDKSCLSCVEDNHADSPTFLYCKQKFGRGLGMRLCHWFFPHSHTHHTCTHTTHIPPPTPTLTRTSQTLCQEKSSNGAETGSKNDIIIVL